MKTSNLTNGLLILVLLIVFTSCRHNGDAHRAAEIFFLGVLQVINMFFFGICAVIFCVLAGTNGKPVFKALGWVFLSIFAMFAMMGFLEVQSAGPRHNEIYFIFMMEAVMIILSFVFVIRSKKPVSESKRQSDLDNIINDNEVL